MFSYSIFFFFNFINFIIYINNQRVIIEGPQNKPKNYQPPPIEEADDDLENFSSEFNEEWDKKMFDYDSEYVYYLPLKYKTKETYFENITLIPARIRGAFIVDEEAESKIDFQILNPNNEIIFSKTSHQAIFDINANETGKYTIIFNNKYVNKELKVTFTMSSGQNNILKKGDLSITEGKMEKLMGYIKRFNVEFKFNRNIHQERYKKTIALIGISIWQFYYMRHLFEIKGSL